MNYEIDFENIAEPLRKMIDRQKDLIVQQVAEEGAKEIQRRLVEYASSIVISMNRQMDVSSPFSPRKYKLTLDLRTDEAPPKPQLVKK